MRTGVASFTLDYGRCPRWLFERMVRLGRVVGCAIIEEFGTEEFLKRLSDPVWFQSLGTVLAFDWNASGLTTTTLGALKVAFFGLERDYGIFICGGKGKTSRKTPQEIENWGENLPTRLPIGSEIEKLVKISRLTAKVDSSLIQDGFAIYHHNFIFDKTGSWTVIQQGMNTRLMRARRYHWYGELRKTILRNYDITKLRRENVKERLEETLIEEPHTGIITQAKLPSVLDLTAKKSRQNRQVSLELVHSSKTLYRDLKILAQRNNPQLTFKILDLPEWEFSHHKVEKEINQHSTGSPRFAGEADGDLVSFSNFGDCRKVCRFFYDRTKFCTVDFESPRLKKNLEKIVVGEPGRFEELLLTPGVGAKTVRALSLVAEVIYGAKPSYEDPARYSFAHGGKDGTPYPVDRGTYDQTLAVMEKALLSARLYYKEKDQALRRMEKVSRFKKDRGLTKKKR